MAFTFLFRYPDGQERTLSCDCTLDVDRIVELRPPISERDAVAEAERLYATNATPTTSGLTRYRIKAKSQEPRELVYGKIEVISLFELEEIPHG